MCRSSRGERERETGRMGHCWERERDEPAEMARLKLEKGFVKVKERKGSLG